MRSLGAFLFLALLAAFPAAASHSNLDAKLHEVDESGVTGRAMLVDLPAGGTLIVVNLAGLRPDKGYVIVRGGGGACDREGYDEDDAIGTVIANASGRATVTEQVDEDPDELGSIAVWIDEEPALVACAGTES